MTSTGTQAATPDSMIESGKANGTIPTLIFTPRGGRGDASFDDRCPKGRYIVGFGVRSGLWMDQITVICSAVDFKGATSGNQYLRPRGGMGGGPSERRCPPGMVVNSVKFRLTKGDRQVKSLTVGCRATKGGGTSGFSLGATINDGNIGSFQSQVCFGGDAGTGLQGTYGKHVGSIGLICSCVVLPRAPAAPPPPPPPPPGMQPCAAPMIRYSNGTCGCVSGMKGPPKCDIIDLH